MINVNSHHNLSNWQLFTLADLGGREGRPPPHPNSFDFLQFSGNFGKFVCWHPPTGELAPHPRGNPGSANGLLPPGVAQNVNIAN